MADDVPWVPQISAHRGGALIWPENSPTAFRRSARLPVASIETDVHLSRDGRLLVHHDATLERTTTGRGPLRAHLFASLRKRRLKRTRGERLPTLGEVIRLIRRSARDLRLEIKTDRRHRRYPGIERKVAAELRRHRFLKRTVVTSFDWTQLRLFRRHARPKGFVALVGETWFKAQGLAGLVTTLAKTGFAEASIPSAFVTREMVKEAFAKGLGLGAYRVRTEADHLRVLSARVPVFTTDRPDIAIRRRREMYGV
jgi:glycerophosphoryl diester phosphodiesterase